MASLLLSILFSFGSSETGGAIGGVAVLLLVSGLGFGKNALLVL